MRGLESGCDGDGWRRNSSPVPVYEFACHESAREATLFLRTPARLNTLLPFSAPGWRLFVISVIAHCVFPPVAGARQARGVRSGKGGCE